MYMYVLYIYDTIGYSVRKYSLANAHQLYFGDQKCVYLRTYAHIHVHVHGGGVVLSCFVYCVNYLIMYPLSLEIGIIGGLITPAFSYIYMLS